jgi:hypothetical protein
VARAFGGAEPEKIRRGDEVEIASRADATNPRQRLLRYLTGLTAYHDPVRADTMRGKLFDQSFKV